MIDLAFHHYYLLCMLVLVGFFSWVAYDEGWDRVKEKTTKENAFLIAALVASGPLGVLALLSVIFYHEGLDRLRRDCNVATTRWEKTARHSSNLPMENWDWYTEENKENRFNALRETIYCLTDRELKMLANVEEGMFKIDKPMKEALVDEMLHRKILNHE